MANQRKLVDKEALGVEYRAGVKTFKVLGEEFGISAPRVKQIADAEGWERDLSILIKHKAEAKLNAAALNKTLNESTRKASEREIVEANATMQAEIIVAHRSDIRRNRELVSKLTAEVEAITNEPGLIESLENAIGEDVSERQLELFRRIISLPGRIGGVKQLVESLKTLVALEREAFGIDSKKTAGQTLDEFLDGLSAAEG